MIVSIRLESTRMKLLASVFLLLIRSDYSNSIEIVDDCDSTDKFLCSTSKLCISKSFECDGELDCGFDDQSDEDHCNSKKLADDCHDGFLCPQSKLCLDVHMVCDGEVDCGIHDRADESNCGDSEKVVCKENEFSCADRRNCISKRYVCDKVEDCMDGSDEKDCPTECIEFLCKSGECIDESYKCDGYADCKDESDEINCPIWNVTNGLCRLELGKFLCKDKSKCLPLSKVCNSVPDCLDHSDESDTCTKYNDGNPQKPGCYNLPDGERCGCKTQGLERQSGNCIDINECDVYGICDQICNNTHGGYQCTCHEGYKLNEHNICEVEEGEPVMVFSVGKAIYSLYLKSNYYMQMVEFNDSANAVTYDGRHVYFVSMTEGGGSIVRANEFGTEKETLLNSGIYEIEDMVIDWITRNIYFTDSGNEHIAVCSYNGYDCLPIVTSIKNLRALALYSTHGLLFFSSWDISPRIARVDMDGRNMKDLVTEDIMWPNGIALDITTERLYWSDSNLGRIESINIDGSKRMQLHSPKIKMPFSIDIMENRVYWSDWYSNEIESCNKFSGKDHQTVTRLRKKRVFGMHIFHSILLRGHEHNPCKGSRCSHLCLLTRHESTSLNYSCACPINMELLEDRQTCSPFHPPSKLIVATKTTVGIIKLQSFGKFEKKVIKDVELASSIGSMVYNPLAGEIIYSDVVEGSIRSFNLMTNEVKKLYTLDGSKITCMDFDPIGNNLYWADAVSKTVHIFNMNSHLDSKLIWDLGEDVPLDLVLLPLDGLIFLALYSNNHVHIDQFNMDGSKGSRAHLIEEGIIGPRLAMAYDQQLDKIFWADLGASSIYSVEKDGTQKNEHIHTGSSLGDLTVVDDILLWVNIGSKQLHWLNHHGEAVPKFINLDDFANVDELKIIKAGPSPSLNHECQFSNGNCSHFCIPLGSQKKCMCPDGLNLVDGLNCKKLMRCQESEFKCKDGTCIPLDFKCNSRNDCPDGEDEENCGQKAVTCSLNKFACFDGLKCIDSQQECDGFADCDDSSDERNCQKSGRCSNGEFQCASGQCIHGGLQCDNTKNCDDGSDEDNCKNFACDSLNDFKCDSGACIPKSWECDGEVNCEDSSDEHPKCLLPKECPSDRFKCDNGRCIHPYLKCNHEDDCEDFSDEKDCVYETKTEPIEKLNCNDDEFRCDSDKIICVHNNGRCNGTIECPKKEDEENCLTCSENQFKCETTDKCIPNEWLCNREDNCGDNSDEKQCPEIPLSFRPNKCDGFSCTSSGECIPGYQVCDNKTDCSDKSDEGPSCESSCDNSRCSHKCMKMPVGHRCTCPSGFRLDGNGISCLDIDECSLNVCSQFCQNFVGSFRCTCDESNYRLRSDKTSCKAIGPEMEFIFATNNEIRTRTKSGQNINVFKMNADIKEFSGLDVNFESNFVYLTSDIKGVLFRLNLKTREINQIKKLIRPTKVSHESITGNVYFVENGNTIQACNFDKKSCALVYSTSKDFNIDALRIDSKNRVMVWSESQMTMARDVKSVIKRSNLDGKLVSILVGDDVKKVGDIALDTVNKFVFWTDTPGKKIEKISYDGLMRQYVFNNIAGVPNDLDLFEDRIFWLSSKLLSLNSDITNCGLIGEKSCETIQLLPRNSKIKHFRISHQALQSKRGDECERMACTSMCVLSKTSPACICSDGTPGQDCSSQTDKVFVDGMEEREGEKSGSSSPWILWTFFTLFLCALLSWATVVYVLPLGRNFLDRRSKRSPSVHFQNLGYELESGQNPIHRVPISTLVPGDHGYENPLRKENSWLLNMFNSNELKGSKNAWPSLGKDSNLIDSQKLIDPTSDLNPV